MSIPATLQKALREKKVIPFVGAGASMAVLNRQTNEPLFPSWKQLLLDAADRMEEENSPEEAIAVRALMGLPSPDYIYTASLVYKKLKGEWFNFVRERIDLRKEDAHEDSLELAKAIWELGSNLIITTNYDRVLEWSCPQTSNCRHWDIQATAEQAASLRTGVPHPTVWHLHGSITNAANLVFTQNGYQRLYSDSIDQQGYEAALTTLRQHLGASTFLFIGFSLDDPYFGMEMRGLQDIFQGTSSSHYALVRESQVEKLNSLNLNVQPVTFANFGEPLVQLVRELGEISRQPTNPLRTLNNATPPSPTLIEATPNVTYSPKNSYFSVPYRPKKEQLIGREVALESVRKELAHGNPTAIGQAVSFQGLGGLGKTQLAVEYAHTFRDDYPNGVYWLNADQDIPAQLVELCDQAKWLAPESEAKSKLEVARQRLRSHSNCLLVFDNVENQETIEDYLPIVTATPHILITSRREQSGFTPVPLDPLTQVDSLELLYQEAGRRAQTESEIIAAQAIVETLDGLPLALELAGAYLKYRSSLEWNHYNEMLQNNLKNSFRATHASFTKHETDLYSTLKIQEDIFDEEPRLKGIIDLLTWSGSAPMGVSLLCALIGADPNDLRGALELGVALRLLQKSPDSNSYAIHRLVREVRRDDIPLTDRNDWVKEICGHLGDWFEARREDIAHLAAYEAEIDHLNAWQKNAERDTSDAVTRLIWLQAYPPYHRGQYETARLLITEAIERYEKSDLHEETLLAHLLNDLGSAYNALGQYDTQLGYIQKALDIRTKIHGELHPDTAASFNNIGSGYGHLGQHDKQLEYFQKSLDILTQTQKGLHPNIATALNNIGMAYGDIGQYDTQLGYIQKALDIRTKIHGELHPDTASSFNNVGAAYGNLGHYDTALEYIQKALGIRTKIHGELHPDTAISFNNVGSVYGELGQHDKQLEYLQRALDIRTQVLGESHPTIATSFNNIGLAYGELGQYDTALEYIQKALGIRTKIHGELHPKTIITVHNLVLAYRDYGKRSKAFELADKYLRLLPSSHPEFDELKQIAVRLLATPLRPGFRQDSVQVAEKRWGKAIPKSD
jgi:tetratricopeptide (TPR) repeat protein